MLSGPLAYIYKPERVYAVDSLHEAAIHQEVIERGLRPKRVKDSHGTA